MFSSPRRGLTAVLLVCGMVVLLSRCDLPTKDPNFAFTTNLRAPLLFDKTFVLIGPSDTGHEALIDTTDATFDSLFTVDGSNNIFIIQDLDDFEIGDLDALSREINLEGIDVAVSIGELIDQTFSAFFGTELGIFTLDPALLPPELGQEIPVIPPPAGGAASFEVPNFLVPPQVDLVNLSNVTLEAVRFTDDTEGVNAFEIVLLNDLGQRLTSASDPANPPTITLSQNGTEIGSGSFGFVEPGAQGMVRISLAGQTVSRENFVYTLDVGTDDGIGPLLAAPGAVRVRTDIEPLEYAESTVSEIPAQDGIDASIPEIAIGGGDVDFKGLIAASGQLTLFLTNTLPIPVTIDVLEVRNLDAVGRFPAGSVVFSATDQPIGAGQRILLSFPLRTTPIASRVEMTLTASSTGFTGLATLSADDGFAAEIEGAVEIERLFFNPDGESFVASDVITVDVENVVFDSADDYVELKAGVLEIFDLTNGLDLNFDIVEFSVPGIRRAPYRVQDRLVVRFEGDVDRPADLVFRRLERNSAPRDVSIDMTNLRIFPVGGELPYTISAVSASPGVTRILDASDQITANVRAAGLKVRAIQATLDPFTVAITDDDNGDGRLDVSTGEADISELSDFQDLSEKDIQGLRLQGAELTLNITTNVGANFSFYGALLGEDANDASFYLQGRNAFAVAATDTVAASFLANGAPIPPANLIRFPITGAPSADQSVTRSIVLNNTNSSVDEFISNLPVRMRYVGKVLLEGGPISLREPFEIGATLGASVPLNIRDDFSFKDTVDADLETLQDLTDPTKDATFEDGELLLFFENGLPLGINARLDVLGPAGQVQISLPTASQNPLVIEPAPVGANGAAEGTTPGMVAIPLSKAEFEALGRGKTILLNLTFLTSPTGTARLRANDTLTLRLQADFNLKINVGK